MVDVRRATQKSLDRWFDPSRAHATYQRKRVWHWNASADASTRWSPFGHRVITHSLNEVLDGCDGDACTAADVHEFELPGRGQYVHRPAPDAEAPCHLRDREHQPLRFVASRRRDTTSAIAFPPSVVSRASRDPRKTVFTRRVAACGSLAWQSTTRTPGPLVRRSRRSSASYARCRRGSGPRPPRAAPQSRERVCLERTATRAQLPRRSRSARSSSSAGIPSVCPPSARLGPCWTFVEACTPSLHAAT